MAVRIDTGKIGDLAGFAVPRSDRSEDRVVGLWLADSELGTQQELGLVVENAVFREDSCVDVVLERHGRVERTEVVWSPSEDVPGLDRRVRIVSWIELPRIVNRQRRKIDRARSSIIQRTTAAEDVLLHETDRGSDEDERHARVFELGVPDALDFRWQRLVGLDEIGELVEDDDLVLST